MTAPVDLRGRTVVVTGASGGIGTALVDRFLAAGAVVVAQSRRPWPPDAEGPGPSARLHRVRVDIDDDVEVEAMLEGTGARHGPVDVLVNNAGAYPVTPLLETSPAGFSDVVRANLESSYRCLHFAARSMARRGGGAVVNIASVNASRPAPDQAAYGAAKAALVALTRSAALDLAPLGVRVNAVSPGLVDRPGIRDSWPEGVAAWERSVPTRRLVRPDEVADACLFLASDAASSVTGHELLVDGGGSLAPVF